MLTGTVKKNVFVINGLGFHYRGTKNQLPSSKQFKWEKLSSNSIPLNGTFCLLCMVQHKYITANQQQVVGDNSAQEMITKLERLREKLFNCV